MGPKTLPGVRRGAAEALPDGTRIGYRLGPREVSKHSSVREDASDRSCRDEGPTSLGAAWRGDCWESPSGLEGAAAGISSTSVSLSCCE